MSGREASSARAAVEFAVALGRAAGWRLLPAFSVALALALTEGAGLVLLVPLLGSIGLVVSDGPTRGIAAWTARALGAVGISATLPSILAVFLGVSVLYAALYRAHLLLAPALEQGFVLGLRQRLYGSVVSARWSFLVERRMSDVVHALLSDMDRVSGSAYQLLTLAATAATAAVYILVAARISSWLTALVCGGALVALWLVRGRTRAATERGAALSDANRRLYAMLTESLAALKIAKTVGAEARDAELYARLAHDSSAQYIGLLRSFADAKLRLDLASGAGVTILLLVAVLGFHLQGASLLLLVFVFARVMPRMLSLQDSMQLFLGGLPAFGNIMRLVAACEAAAEPHADALPARMPLRQRVQLEGVRFAYGADARQVLDGLTCTLQAGRVTAVVGASGAGKSTLADIVLGLLTPDAGRVLIDGDTLTRDRLAAWRRSVGYVPQDTFLLHDTIRQNMRWACPGASDEDIWRALGIAAARTFVDALPAGLDTSVGDRGVRLSGGERQRLALARALLAQPSLLVLDEATNALDLINEQQILDAVGRLHGAVTVLLITHRLSTVRDADVIHVLASGRIAESGTWAELLARQGTFAALWRAQSHASDVTG